MLNPDPQAFRAENSNAAVIGSIAPKGAGRWEISCKLLDVVSGKLLDNFVNTSTTGNLRMAAHQIADRIYFRLTGTPGCFASRIAYVQNRGGVYELVIADSDGENPRVALRSREPIISPTWAPNGTSLAYVSFESRKPVVYIHELMSGHRRVVANFPGNNSAPGIQPGWIQACCCAFPRRRHSDLSDEHPRRFGNPLHDRGRHQYRACLQP